LHQNPKYKTNAFPAYVFRLLRHKKEKKRERQKKS
jgi:hypothetical protein